MARIGKNRLINRLVPIIDTSYIRYIYGCIFPCHTYNKLGNITSAAGQSYSYSDTQHKQAVTSISPNQSFGYDAHGNMTTRTDGTGSYSQTYDAENRLISVNKSGVGTTTFGYDANGQRATTLAPDGTLTNTPFPAYEQSYPTARQDTFPVNAANWNLESGGNWTWSSQFYVSNTTSNNALTTLKSATLGSSGVIAASIRANNNKNGYLVFDYQNVDNYKYIGLNAQTDRWVFGQRANGTNSDLYVLNQTVNNNQWYDVKVILSGNTAKLYVNGAYKAQYTYPATFTGGKVGLRAVSATTYFDNFLVSNAEISRSTYAIAGQTIATRISGDPVSSNNGLFYLFSDHLGSTSVLATTAGSQVPGSRATYYPFGSPRTTPTQTITDRNFTGQKENMELGLIYYNARYYVPGSGRFLTPDTMIPNPAQPQSFNRYSYTRNNPTNRVDPAGHVDCSLLGDSDDIDGCNDPLPTIPQGPMVAFDGEGWVDGEQSTLTASAIVTGTALAKVINEQHPGWHLTPKEAFMLVYGDTVTFTKTGQSCLDATGYEGCWGRSTGRNSIEIFTDVLKTNGKSKLVGDVHWAVHELGHSFVSAVGKSLPIDTLKWVQDLDIGFPDRPGGSDKDETWGFAGGRWEWQRSSSGWASEEFADMYLGWVYNRWEMEDGSITVAGQARADFMNFYMPYFVEAIINR